MKEKAGPRTLPSRNRSSPSLLLAAWPAVPRSHRDTYLNEESRVYMQ